MHSPAFAGGQRPACPELPPTLQPRVLRAAAPPPDRRLSALTAILVYELVAAALWLAPSRLGKVQASLPARSTREVILDLGAAPLRASTPPPRAGRGEAGIPQESPERPTPLNPRAEEVPEYLTAQLPIGGTETGNVGSAGAGGSGEGAAAPGLLGGSGPAGPGSVLELGGRGLGVLRQVPPAYPAMARAAHLQGPVELMLLVDEQGVPLEVQVLSGHPAFHTEALRAARLWRFQPALDGGRPVRARFRLSILFRLQGPA